MAHVGAGALLAPDLRKRIEIMAEHIARNGPEFEATVKQKNVNNPQFMFLYSGEGAEYYTQVLHSHRGVGRGGPPSASSSAPSLSAVPQVTSSATTCSASESGAATQGSLSALIAGNQTVEREFDLVELQKRWREPPVYPLQPEVDRQFAEILASLEQMASRDAIRGGRLWVEQNVGIAQQIAGHFMKRIVFLPTCSHRLHVLYLIHDLLQTEAARKDGGRELIRAFKPYLVWIVRPSFQLALSASPNGEDGGRVLRLLQLWVERQILSKSEAEEMKALVTATDLPGTQQAPPQPSHGWDTEVAVAPPQIRLPRPALPRPAMPNAGGFANAGGHPAMAGRGAGAMPGIMPQFVPYGNMGAYRPPMHPGLAAVAQAQAMQAVGAGQVQTPETVPVGVMATMLQQYIRLSKSCHKDFVPYKPLDPSQTPQVLPGMAPKTQRLLERVSDFYEDLHDEDRDSRSSSSSRSSSRSRSRSPRRPSSFSAVPPATGAFSAVPPIAA